MIGYICGAVRPCKSQNKKKWHVNSPYGMNLVFLGNFLPTPWGLYPFPDPCVEVICLLKSQTGWRQHSLGTAMSVHSDGRSSYTGHLAETIITIWIRHRFSVEKLLKKVIKSVCIPCILWDIGLESRIIVTRYMLLIMPIVGHFCCCYCFLLMLL